MMKEDICFKINETENSLSVFMGSSLEMIDTVSEKVSHFLDKHGLKSHTFAVCLVLREGLSNSVRHAHQQDPDKIVNFSLEISGNELIMEIEDQGKGFDWKERLDVVDESFYDPMLEHGRGMKIMDQYFCSIKYNEKGNKLTLKRSLNR